MDDQRTNRKGWQLVTDANRKPHVLPFCIFLLLCFVIAYWARPNFWNLKAVIGTCFVIAVLIWDKLRVKPKDS
jgi:uncharacterized membrane protein